MLKYDDLLILPGKLLLQHQDAIVLCVQIALVFLFFDLDEVQFVISVDQILNSGFSFLLKLSRYTIICLL